MTFMELGEKEVVDISTGECLGRVDDVEFDAKTKKVMSIAVKGKGRFFGLFGKAEDCIVTWDHILTIGRDAILVETEEYTGKKLAQE